MDIQLPALFVVHPRFYDAHNIVPANFQLRYKLIQLVSYTAFR